LAGIAGLVLLDVLGGAAVQMLPDTAPVNGQPETLPARSMMYDVVV
jgi:hypothetical protein